MTLVDHFKAEVFKKGMAEGIEKGIEKGRKEEKIEMAKALLLKGVDIEIISETTGLSKEEIRKLYS